MHISWHGLTCVKLQTPTATILINPFQDSGALKMPSLKVDIAASTNLADELANNTERLQGDPTRITNPGEYEIAGAFVYGIPAGGEQSLFKVEAEGITVGHPGTTIKQLTEKQLERFEGVDVLFLPITGSDAKARAAFLSAVEPRIIIPIGYQPAKGKKAKEKLDTIDVFAKEMNVKDATPEAKIIIKQNNLPIDGTQVHILDIA